MHLQELSKGRRSFSFLFFIFFFFTYLFSHTPDWKVQFARVWTSSDVTDERIKDFQNGLEKSQTWNFTGFFVINKQQKKSFFFFFQIEWRLDLKNKNINRIFHPRLLNGMQLIEWSDTHVWICRVNQQMRATFKIYSYWEPRISPPLRTTGHVTGTRAHKTPAVGSRCCRRIVLGRPPGTRFPPSFHCPAVRETRRTPLHTAA